jgi:trehalose 6-phosphate phosphatase
MRESTETVAERFRARSASAGVILDFDGTLSPMVVRPESATILDGVPEALGSIVDRYKLTAIVTGRRSAEIRARLPVEGIEIVGLYGAEGEPPIDPAVRRAVAAAIAEAPEALATIVRVEEKGPFLAVHFREASDPQAAAVALRAMLSPIASSAGLDLMEGKRVIEFAPQGRTGKGAAVIDLVRAHQLEGAVFAGDDLADLDAFVALDELAADGLLIAKVAVGGTETPDAIIRAADLTVAGPAGLLALLQIL